MKYLIEIDTDTNTSRILQNHKVIIVEKDYIVIDEESIPTVDKIISTVKYYYKLKEIHKVNEPTKRYTVAKARKFAAIFIKDYHKVPNVAIADMLGYSETSSVTTGIKKCRELITYDKEYMIDYEGLKYLLKQNR